MACRKQSRPEVEQVRPYLEGVAKNLVDRLYGSEASRGRNLVPSRRLVSAIHKCTPIKGYAGRS